MSQYDDRPWLALYDDGVPADLEAPFPDCMTMFDAALRHQGDAPLIPYYFGTTMTVAVVDRSQPRAGRRDGAECGLHCGDRVVVQLQNVPTILLQRAHGRLQVPAAGRDRRRDSQTATGKVLRRELRDQAAASSPVQTSS